MLSAVLSALASIAMSAAAQGYPSKTVRFVITYPAGGGSDFTVRPIAAKLTERWGQPVVVDILDKLHGDLVGIIHSPDYRQRQLEAATDIVGSTPEALSIRQRGDIEKYRKIAAAAGIKPE